MFKRITIITLSLIMIFSVSSVTFAVERFEILQVGDEDSYVLELQTALNKKGYLEFPATGYFGTDTQNAVIKFQQEVGLAVDGKAGPTTRISILGDDYSEITQREVNDFNSSTDAIFEGTQIFVDPITVSSTTNDVTKVPIENYLIPAPPSNTSAAADVDTLKSGDKGDEVSKMQTRLTELEYYEYGSITGYYGPVTEEAVKKFQRTNGLEVNGIMNKSTLDLLYSEKANYYTMFPGDRGDDILKMQEKLINLGYFSGETTGYYGDATVQAVKMFQSSNNLSVDGKAGKSTRKVLYSDDAVKSSSSTTPPQPSNAPNPTKKPVESAKPTEKPSVDNPAPIPTPAPVPEQPAPTPVPTSAPITPPPVASGTGLDKCLEIAQSLTGMPYVYATSGPNSFDCSGFVYYCLKNSGVATGRLSSAGYATVSSWTSISDVNSLSSGDLVFFCSDNSKVISHMGIYLGGGSFIHAAPSNGGVATSSMSSGYYARNFMGAKRMF